MLWSLRARSLSRAGKAFARSEPEGLHDLRVALRRVETTAAALGKKIERKSRSLVRSLSPLRQLEVDRQLLSRLREMGHLPENVADALEAGGARTTRNASKAAPRPAEEPPAGRRLRHGAPPAERRPVPARDRAAAPEGRLLPPRGRPPTARHRYRIAVKRARCLTEDLAACGVPGLENRIERGKELRNALGRWNDIRLFRERLKRPRGVGREGSVGLVVGSIA
jgi:CHAD domain-containing protein